MHVEYYDKNGRRVDPAERHGWGKPDARGGGLRGRRVFEGIPGSFPKGTTREQAQAEIDAKKGGTAARPQSGPVTGSQREFLMEHRSRIMKELQGDPAKMERFMGLVQAEAGNDPAAQKAVAETIIDRWSHRGQTVEQGIASSYYGNNPRYRQPSAETRKQFPGIMGQVGEGSASYPGATGNASGSVLRRHAGRGEVAGKAGKEGIIFEPQDADFRRRLDESLKRDEAAKASRMSGTVDFSGMNDKLNIPAADEPGVFKILNLGRADQGGKSGGSMAEHNRFATE